MTGWKIGFALGLILNVLGIFISPSQSINLYICFFCLGSLMFINAVEFLARQIVIALTQPEWDE
jgi:hypothetical protein